jgi:hypothetical protein
MLSVKAIRRTLAGAGALTLAVTAMPSLVQAQTAADINRASAAMQICASPMGAGIPECAQLKQQLGVGGGNAGANAGGGAAAAGALLNGLANRGGGGGGGLAGLLGAMAGQAAQAAAPAAPPAGSADYYNQAAGATYNAAAGYQACVAANPTNWQSCVAQMNGGGAPAAVPGAVAVAPGLNLTGAALAGYQRCLQANPADKCAQAYGAYNTPATAAAAPAQGGAGNTVANAASAVQTAKQLAPTIKALGSFLGR